MEYPKYFLIVFWVCDAIQIQIALSAFFWNDILFSKEIEEIKLYSDNSINELPRVAEVILVNF